MSTQTGGTVKCSCCDMTLGTEAHRAEAERQACGPCLIADSQSGREVNGG